MNRRTLLGGFMSLPLALALRPWPVGATSSADIESMQQNWRELLPPDFSPPDANDTLQRSAEEWRRLLSKQAFHVLREEGTERAFTSPLNDEHRAGLFLCAACNLPLFSSAMKYDSGTGWPSFFTHIPAAMGTRTDFKLIWPRTEYHCIRCGGHQGHVFKDGPPPTGERWCNNGVALRFLPSA
ncbi:peptide-methionine (R)-S-oxide reductase [Seongchinamella sediminis]|uniref:peptide-methionine (R)-S-oxide reductase n=1 Tax=Seongchinamella sediminis TaxID=2283635 RepID=A0A3L7DXV5_9GAMM|nr:peptide-methionine (R)-S-oxide reductase MsrB [Seongchinamella sediminis]RLQ20672.1 peptide-methionine (R)-S-oxide reductase [Seongchinamella sediminis]